MYAYSRSYHSNGRRQTNFTPWACPVATTTHLITDGVAASGHDQVVACMQHNVIGTPVCWACITVTPAVGEAVRVKHHLQALLGPVKHQGCSTLATRAP
jgi:hypothetical protein